MPKNMLKNYGRFELLELIYAMRKENLELKERCEKLEKETLEIKLDAERRIENNRRDYENRIEELRMQGAAKDLQIRMKKIEEQLRVMQKLTSIDVDLSEMPSDEEIEKLRKKEDKSGAGRKAPGKPEDKAKDAKSEEKKKETPDGKPAGSGEKPGA